MKPVIHALRLESHYDGGSYNDGDDGLYHTITIVLYNNNTLVYDYRNSSTELSNVSVQKG